MPSAFHRPAVEPTVDAVDTSAVRLAPFAGLCLIACNGAPPSPAVPPPEVSPELTRNVPAGTRFRATLAGVVADEAIWRATRVWWREALAQTVRFSMAPIQSDGLPELRLTVAADARALTATMRDGDGPEHVVAVGSYAPDSATPSLPAAIDRLAWATRLALGESVEPPLPVAAATSADPRVVDGVADADLLLRSGSFPGALSALRTARRRDGGAPYVLAPLCALELLAGSDPTAIERTCREALNYTPRLSPTTQHVLLRTLLLADAAREPAEAATYDQRLATLAAVARRERPHDDEPRWTEALAHNFRAEFDRARPVLEELLQRLPEQPFVPYHLGWACLGTGDAAAAATHLERAALRLPESWVLLPRAIALFEAERHDELDRLLDRALAEASADRGEHALLRHQLLRMRAAHALLREQPERARRLIVDDLTLLLKHPLMLEGRAAELAESGAVLVRLGSSPQLPAILAAVQRQRPGGVLADAVAFVGGLHAVVATGASTERTESMLARDGDSPWASLLSAFAHERRGEVGDMQNDLARAAGLASSPMTTALLTLSLRAVGKDREAERLHRTLQRELLEVHLRRPCRHPLFGPELAFAFRPF